MAGEEGTKYAIWRAISNRVIRGKGSSRHVSQSHGRLTGSSRDCGMMIECECAPFKERPFQGPSGGKVHPSAESNAGQTDQPTLDP